MTYSPDHSEWLAQVSRHIDAAKIAVTSNARLPDMALAELASQLESVRKACRAMVDGQQEAQ